MFKEQPGNWWGWSRRSKQSVVRNGIREVSRCEMTVTLGHGRKGFEFYSLCKEKPLASFEKKSDIILLSF